MGLQAGCPRCPSPLNGADGSYACAEHGEVVPLWRPHEAAYEGFTEVMALAADTPTYLPWPMSPGWSVADFGCVPRSPGHGGASVTTTVGSSDLDGPIELTLVSEDPLVGLGGRCAGLAMLDPGEGFDAGSADIRVQAGGRQVPLWALDSHDADPWIRSVFVGEADGRWLWLVIRPASAALLLRDTWLLADITGFGPEVLDVPFGGDRPRW